MMCDCVCGGVGGWLGVTRGLRGTDGLRNYYYYYYRSALKTTASKVENWESRRG